MITRLFSPLLLSLFLAPFLSAQLPDAGTSWRELEPVPGALALQLSDSRRQLKDGAATGNLKMSQVMLVAQAENLAPLIPRVEAGWHDPELLTDSSGGFVWGLGLAFRPFRQTLRRDPETGPRDWVAMLVDLSYRSGEADEITWSSIEGYVGLEWNQVLLGSDPGPLGAGGMILGGGVLLSSLEAEEGGFDGSEDASVGFRISATYRFRGSRFLQLEADWFGSSDRVLAVTAGTAF